MHVPPLLSAFSSAALFSGCLIALAPLAANAADPEAAEAPSGAASAVETSPAPDPSTNPDNQPEQTTLRSTLETWQDFLDGLVVNALGPNPERRYRVDGRRKLVDLGKRWTLSLDERPTGRLSSAGVGIPAAGQPARTWEILHEGRTNQFRAYNQHDGTGRENGGSVWTTLAPGWTWRTQGLRLHDDNSGIARTDVQTGLRVGSSDLWVEGFVRSAGLQDHEARESWVDHEPRATFGGVQTQWQVKPGLNLNAQYQRAIKPNMLPGDERLADARTEFGVDYQPTGMFSGTRMYWREAPQLGLLSSSGLEERDTYRRVLGIEAPEGSRDGLVYVQVRHQSLLDDSDALMVVGWRHTTELAPKWSLQTLVESGIPVGGDNAVRSNTFDVRLANNDFPDHSFYTELQAVRTPLKNTAFASADYTRRIGDSSVAVIRGSVTGVQPHDRPTDIPTNSAEFSTGLGWQEPEERQFSTFWRYTFIGRNALFDKVTNPDFSDRRAHIGSAEFDWQGRGDYNYLLLAARRWNRDDAFQEAELRTTNLAMARVTKHLAERWDLGVHVARLNDSALPAEHGFGANLSVQLNHRVVLALGYNPRGIEDGELAGEERLSKGATLRLFIPTDATLTHWLKAPRPAKEETQVSAAH